MGEGALEMENFSQAVERELGAILARHGYQRLPLASHDESKLSVFFARPSCELEIYKSLRDGEVNCLVRMREGAEDGWRYLRSLLTKYNQLDEDELFAAIPDKPLSEEGQLELIRRDLQQFLEADRVD